ncbi:hemolysin family protein [Gimibacter soli]|uniref:Hemolysin family protein n=1 Tax=Gimibacter soli TaxID=3024400 RepID=A0AAF0BLJ9_9PROT|nr:hemolysin family protein [Gimibacter soli]WCL54242.1 hemolysin family protein [Gimibacter soli]
MTEKPERQESSIAAFWRGLFGRGNEVTLRESLEEALEEHEEDSDAPALGEAERTMLFNVLDYSALMVEDIMVPRADIVGVSASVGFDDLIKLFSSASHSRLPIYRDALDEILGMVHVKDALKLVADEADTRDFRVSSISRPVLFVAPSMKVMDLLARMRKSRTHMAIVVDEYGGTDGLVTIEDLVEQIVGEIEDEHDETDVPALTDIGNGGFDADARLELEALEDKLGFDLLPEEDADDVDTLGGLVFSLAGRVPDIGEVIPHESGYSFEVLDADPRRIRKVRIHAPKPGAPITDE